MVLKKKLGTAGDVSETILGDIKQMKKKPAANSAMANKPGKPVERQEKEKTVSVLVRLSASDKELLKQLSSYYRVSANEYIIQLIRAGEKMAAGQGFRRTEKPRLPAEE